MVVELPPGAGAARNVVAFDKSLLPDDGDLLYEEEILRTPHEFAVWQR